MKPKTRAAPQGRSAVRREAITRKKPRHTFDKAAHKSQSCLHERFIGYRVHLIDSDGHKYSGTLMAVTDTHISVNHQVKGYRMFACADVEILAVKKKGAGCGCGSKRS